jgi:hypothetical protein
LNFACIISLIIVIIVVVVIIIIVVVVVLVVVIIIITTINRSKVSSISISSMTTLNKHFRSATHKTSSQYFPSSSGGLRSLARK